MTTQELRERAISNNYRLTFIGMSRHFKIKEETIVFDRFAKFSKDNIRKEVWGRPKGEEEFIKLDLRLNIQ